MRNILRELCKSLGYGLFVVFLTVVICGFIFGIGLLASNLLLLSVF